MTVTNCEKCCQRSPKRYANNELVCAQVGDSPSGPTRNARWQVGGQQCALRNDRDSSAAVSQWLPTIRTAVRKPPTCRQVKRAGPAAALWAARATSYLKIPLYNREAIFYNKVCHSARLCARSEEREPACVALHREGCGVESILEAAGVWISPGSICP